MRNHPALLALALASCSCALQRRDPSFHVIPGRPDYLLQSPDASETPFPQVLTRYNGFIPGSGQVDLRAGMELRIENAYYREGAPKHGLNGFLGTEIARYRITGGGELHLESVRSALKRRPVDQEPVQALIHSRQKRYPHHRFFYAIVFRREGSTRGSVLLGADSGDALDHLSTQLLRDPDSVCDGSPRCTVFPEACSVALEMEIRVNGARRAVLWGSPLSSIASGPNVSLRRVYNGRLTNVDLDPADPAARHLPLLPGDRVESGARP